MKRDQDGYETFDGFLRVVIKGYWESRAASKVNFLALLLASREAWQVAWGEATASPGKILGGAAGAAALAVVLRTFLGGPIGILLTGATVASLVTVYVKNHERIWRQVARYRKLLGDYRHRFDQVQRDYAEGEVDREQRDLMIDGLMSRFLTELDEEPEAAGEEDSFAGHVERRRDEEHSASNGSDGAGRDRGAGPGPGPGPSSGSGEGG